MNDESDLPLLTSIILGSWALYGDLFTIDSNSLIMKSIDEIWYWLIDLPSLSIFKGNRWNFSNIGKVSIESMNDDIIRNRYS